MSVFFMNLNFDLSVVRNILRRLAGFNTTVLYNKKEKDSPDVIPKTRAGRVDMQLPVDPRVLSSFVAAAIYGLTATGKTIIYTLSLGKALVVASATTALIRPGIPFRAIREVEKVFARIIGYRNLTPIANQEVAQAMSSYLLTKMMWIASSPAGITALVGLFAFMGLSALKNWVEFLITYLRGGDGERMIGGSDPQSQRFLLDGGSSLAEENRRLRAKVKRLELTRRPGRRGSLRYDEEV
jgi:hypothetical protein